MSLEAIEIRKYRADWDKPFLFSTWLRNYKHSSYFAKRIKPGVFFAGHHKIIEHLTTKPTVHVTIACPKDDAETILGYLAHEPREDGRHTIHFVFVKEAFRQMGVARALLRAAGIEPGQITFTHWTFPVDELIRKYPEITYNPYEL